MLIKKYNNNDYDYYNHNNYRLQLWRRNTTTTIKFKLATMTHKAIYTCNLGEGKLGEGKLWFQTGADGAHLASSGKSIEEKVNPNITLPSQGYELLQPGKQ